MEDNKSPGEHLGNINKPNRTYSNSCNSQADQILVVRGSVALLDDAAKWMFSNPGHWLMGEYLKIYNNQIGAIEDTLCEVEMALREKKNGLSNYS